MKHMINYIEKAEVLIEALPYIRQFYGKTLVIKYGGNAMIDEKLKKMVAQDIVLMRYVGINPVLVHGGGPEIDALLKRLSIPTRFVDGLRVTDAETVDVVGMVLSGKVNKSIVSLIQQVGGKAVGLSGIDGRLFEAVPKDLEKLGYVGEIRKVNPEVVHGVIASGAIPVISSVASDESGQLYNVNADTAAGDLAAALKAEKMILMTDVPGVLEDIHKPDSLIHSMTLEQVKSLMDSGTIKGGMIPKLECCMDAVRKGVPSAHIIDGRVSHSLLLEVFTDAGIGTQIIP